MLYFYILNILTKKLLIFDKLLPSSVSPGNTDIRSIDTVQHTLLNHISWEAVMALLRFSSALKIPLRFNQMAERECTVSQVKLRFQINTVVLSLRMIILLIDLVYRTCLLSAQVLEKEKVFNNNNNNNNKKIDKDIKELLSKNSKKSTLYHINIFCMTESTCNL